MSASAKGVSPLDPSLMEEAALIEGGFCCVAGIDEVGRGAWAGPLVAAAVILPESGSIQADALLGVRDSKLLTPEQRESAFETIVRVARAAAVGWVPSDEVDLLGLTAANELAMSRAVRALEIPPDFLLVDAFKLPSLDQPQRAIIRGDRHSLSIAAASIVAKVYRDRWCEALGGCHPGYGFELHRGYGVALHQRAISERGPSPIHRMSYAPLRAAAR